MTKQEIFDKVASHLLTQNARSISRGMCLYRGPLGLKCAAGFLIPDDVYNVSMEGVDAEFVFRKISQLSDFNEHVDLISRLQRIHDGYEVALWKEKLEELAKVKNLSSDILKNF